MCAQIAMRRENWPFALSRVEPHDSALFAVDREEYQETYLLWQDAIEPGVVTYSSGDEYCFHDLAEFVRFLLGRPSGDGHG